MRGGAGARVTVKSGTGESAAEMLHYAALHEQAGNPSGARQLYRKVLDAHPSDLSAIYGLAQTEFGLGEYAAVAKLATKGLRIRPKNVQLHVLAGRAFKALGELDNAIRCYRHAVQIEPMRADLHVNLGIALRAKGKVNEAILSYERAIELEPDFMIAHHNLANAWMVQGRTTEARMAYERVLKLNPTLGEAHFELANLERRRGLRDEALKRYRQALKTGLSSCDNYVRLGNALAGLNDLDGAVECFRVAVEKEPRNTNARFALGGALYDLGRFDEAIATFSQALAMDPESAEALVNLGAVLRGRGRREEAIACFERAIERAPGLPEAHLNLGIALADFQDLDNARKSVERAIELAPKSDEALVALAMIARKSLDFGRALELCALALERGARLPQVYMDLGAAHVEAGEAAQGIECYRTAAHTPVMRQDALASIAMAANYVSCDPMVILDAHREFDREFALPLLPAVTPHAPRPSIRRKLRVGYVSPDFRRHAVASFFEPLLANHDPDRFEVVCYFNHPGADEVTARLRGMAGEWRDCVRWSDEELAGRIRDDGIDILVDLAGHTSWNRILTFARRPAPVQASWLGYPGTTGLSAMDYRITDWEADPEGSESHGSEKPLRLPHSYFCFQPQAEAEEGGELPAAKSGRVTFGSFNNAAKAGPETLDLWSEVLRAVPRSDLVLKHKAFGDPQVQQRIRSRFEQRGVDTSRILMSGWMRDQGSHMMAYHGIDIALDTFPYNGATTTCEALWMGVPVVSMSGLTQPSRMGRSILTAAGFPEWAAPSPARFVQIACSLSDSPEDLSAHRAGLRTRIKESALTDAQSFARAFEQCLEQAWTH